MFVDQTTVDGWASSKRPTPSKQVPSSHGLTNVGKHADVPWEFLMLNAYFGSIGTVELATEYSRTTEQRVVAFNFPAFDRGDVESKAPNGPPQQQDQAKKN